MTDAVTPFIARPAAVSKDSPRGFTSVQRETAERNTIPPVRPTTIERIYAERGYPANDDGAAWHDHPNASLFVYLVGAATLLVGILIWFAK